MRAALSLAIGSVLLAACGGDKGQTGTEQQAIDYSQLQTTPQSITPLTTVDQSELDHYLKNGIRLQLSARGGSGGNIGGALPPIATDSGGGKGESGGFSATNVHVQGVDEADYAKYDGSHWFVATYPQYQLGQNQAPGFQIVATDPAAPNAEIVGAFSFDKEWGDVASLYLVQQDETTSHVAAIRNQWGNVYPVLPGFPIALLELDVAFPAITTDAIIARPGPQNSKVRVQLVDVSEPSAPEQDWEIELDGSLIDSRKIGNTLYLITRFDPWLPELRFESGDSTIRDSNEDILQDTMTEELLPHYRVGDTDYPLTRDCLVQEPISDRYGLGSLIHITAVDLASKNVLGSTCLNSNVEVMSMSLNSLYLTGTVYDSNARAQNTVIHKFSLAETGPVYEATGSVTGSLGWNSDPAFRLHEYEGDLRIVTSNRTNTGLTHHLTILRQRLNVLATQGDLPNSANPDPIGKPGEDIYAVRFVGTRAYIVTFQRTDPLYALDLTEPGQPRVLGELEIPGFATYMHPVGENFLFTLGHSADEAGRVTGIKADLFDVSGDTPKVINSIGLGEMGSHSEALSNLRALSLLQSDNDQLRIAFPLTKYVGRTTPASGLQLLEINGITGEASLDDAGMIYTGDTVNYGGVSRAILHDEAVFFAHNNMFWAANWDDPENPIGPITKEPIGCDASVLPSLRVTVFGENADPSIDFCQATVTAIWADGRYELDVVPNTDLIAPPDGKPCVFVGPYEVSGVMDLHVEMPGYQPFSIADLFVRSGICHVQTYESRPILIPE
jgi:hypothetical protein